jgi:putative endonuclease
VSKLRRQFRIQARPPSGCAYSPSRLNKARHQKLMPVYSIYLVRCRNGSLYTGIATDVARRLAEHEDGAKGAKYLRGKRPLKLVYERKIGDRSLALKIECRIKRLTKEEKADVNRLSARIDGFLDESADY